MATSNYGATVSRSTENPRPTGPIMDPERQLPEHATRTFDMRVVAPLVAAGVGIAGAAAYFLTRKRETKSERLMRLLSEQVDAGRETAGKAARQAGKFTGKAAETAGDLSGEAVDVGAQLVHQLTKLLERGGTAASKAADRAGHFATHEGREFAEDVLESGQKAARQSARTAKKSYKSFSPILYGMLGAAAWSQIQKMAQWERDNMDGESRTQARSQSRTSAQSDETGGESKRTTTTRKRSTSTRSRSSKG